MIFANPRESRIYLGVACAEALAHAPLNSLPFEVGAIRDALHLSASTTGMLATLELGAYAVTNIIVSPFIHRLPIRRFALVGGSVALLATFLTGFTDNIVVFGIARALAGAGFGCILGAASAAGAAALVPERAYSVGMGVSIIFGIMIPQILAHSMRFMNIGPFALLPHSGVFLGIACITAPLIPTMLFLPERTANPLERQIVDPAMRPSRHAVVAAIAVMIFFSVAVFSMYTFIEREGSALGMDTVQVANMLSVAVGLGIMGTVASTWLGCRAGLTIPLVAGLAVQGISCLVTAMCTSSSQLWLVSIINMATWYFVFPYIMGLGAALDRSGRLPTAVGAAYVVGSSVAAPLAGFFVDRGSFLGIGLLSLLLCAASGTFALCVSRMSSTRTAMPVKRLTSVAEIH
ncbi:MAG TPA: MFS transporter [Steroidobacteraceae bacterium]|nr:MFS transporter [Steroidobacteraceae bacterium]